MEISDIKQIKGKDLIVFDLDGTLIQTKSPMDPEMSDLFAKLLKIKKVAVIGGGKFEVFQELFLHTLESKEEDLEKLFLFPTTGGMFYMYDHGWKKVYELCLEKEDVEKIKNAFEEVFQEIGYVHPTQTYGEIIEDRGAEVSFSVFGQDVVKVLGPKGVQMKENWIKDNLELKMKIVNLVGEKLPDFEVRAAGFTTIDVTRLGIDKAYGLKQMEKYIKVPIERMLYVGDAIWEGGNDYAVVGTGVDYFKVKGPEQTKELLKKI